MPVSDVPTAQATAFWMEACAAAGCPPMVDVVRVPVGDALGRVTAAPIWARRSSPAFDSAGMDGIAVVAATTVGASPDAPLLIDDAEVIDTGDPIPAGFDAVVPREQLRHAPDGRIELRAAVEPYRHVRAIGEDVCAGELLLPAGHRLRPTDLAAVAAAGAVVLDVRRAPRVVIVPTGDEIVPVGTEPGPGEILDTNSIMLAAQARELGCDTRVTAIVPDDPAAITAAVHDTTGWADLVIVIAGSSKGRGDHTAAVVDAAGVLAVHGVAVRPGHPVVLGVVDATPVLGAPGYPVSAALSFDGFAGPMLARLEGAAASSRPSATARLVRRMASPPRSDDWVRVRLARIGSDLVASPIRRGAGVLTSLVRADALLVVPAGVDGYGAGERVRVELLRGRAEIDATIVVMGASDTVLDLAAVALRAADPLAALAMTDVGSRDGLLALRDGVCHAAVGSVPDPPALAALLGFEPAVVRLARCELGLVVAPGNPLGVTDVDDLVRVRFVNRRDGSGTRAWLDGELARRGPDPTVISGWSREAPTHLAVAAAVAAGGADAGIATVAAARAFGLDVVPLGTASYDLVVPASEVDSDLLTPLWRVLDGDAFRADVEGRDGYSCAETGKRLH